MTHVYIFLTFFLWTVSITFFIIRVCLQRISKRGHNREIAQRINPGDYFGVFNAMLASELSILGKIAVGGVLDGTDGGGAGGNKGGGDSVNDIDELISNFKRICSSNAYTYFYAMLVRERECAVQ